jgi:hypothetical protein
MKSRNKNIMMIIKNNVGENKQSWYSKLKYDLWADRITSKQDIKENPF